MRKSNKVSSRVLKKRGKMPVKEEDITTCDGFDEGSLCATTSSCQGTGYDDTFSVSSFSTTATADNIPGTGRTIDMFFFQPAGRWIERLAMRISISRHSPAQISRYIEANFTCVDTWPYNLMPLNSAISNICDEHRNGKMVVVGLKSLVKQTQSRSINRSATALAALIRTSAELHIRPFYSAVSRVEPIFRLKSLAESLDNCHPEKKYFLFLAYLASVNSVVAAPRKSSLEQDLTLRQRLVCLVKSYRNVGDPFEVLNDACYVFTQAAMHESEIAHAHAVETLFFATILILRLISDLADRTGLGSKSPRYTVLSTLVFWLDYSLERRFWSHPAKIDYAMLDAMVALQGLILAVGEFLPRSFLIANSSQFIEWYSTPRRIRCTFDAEENPIIVANLIEMSRRRSQRLLSSINELEWEVQGSALRLNNSWSQPKVDIGVAESTEELRRTLARAQRAQVEETDLTEDFREARTPQFYRGAEDWWEWRHYRALCRKRRLWGQYFRSNLDWDSDVTYCMKRMFEPSKKQTRASSSRTAKNTPDAYPEPEVDILSREAWNMSTVVDQECLPKTVRIPYKTATGEIRYKTFMSCPSIEDVTSPDAL